MRVFLSLISAAIVLIHCGPPRPTMDVDKEAPLPSYEEVSKGLNSTVWSERSQAVLIVGKAGYKQAIPKLMQLLQTDPHMAVRQTSALILGDLGEQAAVPIIAQILASGAENPDTWIDALARLKNPAAAYAVIPFLNSPTQQVRLGAINALSEMRAQSAGPAVLNLAVGNQDRDLAATYAMALGKLGNSGAENYLMGLAQDLKPDPTTAAAVNALGDIKSERSVPLLINVVRSNYPKGRENAVPALVAIRSPAAVAQSYPLFDHDNRDVRFAAVEIIASIPTPDAGERLLQILNKKDKRSMGPVSLTLGKLKYKSARLPIEALLAEKNNPDREVMARSLGWMGDAASSKILIQVLEESGGEGRYGAAFSLGVLKPKEGLKPLMAAAQSGDNRLRQIAIEALGSYADPEALPALESMLKDPVLAIYAIDAIASIPGDDARKLLARHAQESEGGTRKSAILALGRRKEPGNLELLMRILQEDPKGEVRQATMTALTEITGERFSTRSGWVNWFESRKK